MILPDLPMEELGEWEPAGTAAGLATVQLASPLTPDDRLATLSARSQGFVYGVNLLGVTGERTELATTSGVLAKRLKQVTDLPVIMGFGIATPAHAAEVAEVADGVVVASALMRQRLDGASPEQLGEVGGRAPSGPRPLTPRRAAGPDRLPHRAIDPGQFGVRCAVGSARERRCHRRRLARPGRGGAAGGAAGGATGGGSGVTAAARPPGSGR